MVVLFTTPRNPRTVDCRHRLANEVEHRHAVHDRSFEQERHAGRGRTIAQPAIGERDRSLVGGHGVAAGVDRRFDVADRRLAVGNRERRRLHEDPQRAASLAPRRCISCAGDGLPPGPSRLASAGDAGQRRADVDALRGEHAAVTARRDADDAGLEVVGRAEDVVLLGESRANRRPTLPKPTSARSARMRRMRGAGVHRVEHFANALQRRQRAARGRSRSRCAGYPSISK